MKTCSRCKQSLSLDKFTKNKQSRDKLSYWCKNCKKISDKRFIHLPGGGKTNEAEEITDIIFKNNPPLIEIKRESKKRGRQPSKTMNAEELKEYFKAGDRKRRYKRRLAKYGITEDQHKEQLELQNYKCAICQCDIDISAPIDHCHTSLIVRGILCRECNVGLGFFKDQPELLLNAIKYLHQSGSLTWEQINKSPQKKTLEFIVW